MSEAANSTMLERLEEDPKFTLSLSEPHVSSHEAEEDAQVDGNNFDDNNAISADLLARSLHSTDTGLFSNKIMRDGDGNITYCSGLDDNLTDNDAEGETDPEYKTDINCGHEMSSATRQSEKPESDVKMGDPSDYEDVLIILVQGKKLWLQSVGDNRDGRYVYLLCTKFVEQISLTVLNF